MIGKPVGHPDCQTYSVHTNRRPPGRRRPFAKGFWDLSNEFYHIMGDEPAILVTDILEWQSSFRLEDFRGLGASRPSGTITNLASPYERQRI